MSKKFIVKNDDTQKHYSFLYDNLVELPNGDMQTVINFGVDADTEIDLEKSYDKYGYASVGENGLFVQKVGKQKSFHVNPMAKPFEPFYNWYETQMTSSTAPVPLVVSASDQQSGFEAYKAFNTLNASSDTWMTNSNIQNGWIQLDLGSPMVFNYLKVTSRNGTGYDTHAPKDFEILASNDNSTFINLGSINNQTAWKNYEQRTFAFGNSIAYRYYRINVLANNGGVILAINNITFGYEREVK